jgi:drug/metabolite transporter (DMT)-like permease
LENSSGVFLKGVAIALVGAVCFSTKAIFVKLCFRHGVDGITTLMLRMLFSLPFYLILAIGSKNIRNINHKEVPWGKIILLGLVGYYLASLFDFLGLQYITASLERLILFIYPTIVLVIGATVFRRKITAPQIVAVVLSYGGIALACLEHVQVTGERIGLGVFYIILSAITYAIYLVFSDDIIKKIGSVTYTCFSMIVSSVVVLLHYFLLYDIHITGFAWQVYFYTGLMAIISTVIPTFLIVKGISMIGSSNASLVASVGPVATISMSYFILGEPFSAVQALGTLLVLAGVIYLGWSGRKGRSPVG